MSIDRAPVSGFWVACDTCSHEEEADEEEFTSVVSRLKEEGWSVRKVDGEWFHGCPACVRDGKARR